MRVEIRYCGGLSNFTKSTQERTGPVTLANSGRQGEKKMSVNLYFSEAIRQLPNFKSTPYGDGSGDNMKVGSVNIHADKGRLYAMWNEEIPIPEELNDVVEEVSLYNTIPQMAHRESGIYRHESAECELMPGDHGSSKREKPVYLLRAKAKNFQDIQQLIHLIKTGKVRPDESYEGHQQGKHRQQLEAELAKSQHYQHIYCEANKRLNAEMAELRVELQRGMQTNASLREQLDLSEKSFADYRKQFTGACEKNVEVRKFASSLREKSSFFTRSAYVARRLDQILNGATN